MTQDQLLAIVSAALVHDHARVRSMALVIAANDEARSPVFAQKIRRLIDGTPQVMQLQPLPGGLLALASTDGVSLDQMVLTADTRAKLDRVLLEQRERMRLVEHRLRPAKKLLFVGASGTGKTMAARVMAAELGQSLFCVQLTDVIAKFMGETGANLGKIFEQIGRVPGVYLFDEFDALAPARDQKDHSDLSEMRRVVNTLLTLLENDPSDNIIIAATNLGGVIDRAMLRRFDEIIRFERPDAAAARQLIEHQLGSWVPDTVDWAEVTEAVTIGLPPLGHADIIGAVQRVQKDAVLTNQKIAAEALRVALYAARNSRDFTDPDEVVS